MAHQMFRNNKLKVAVPDMWTMDSTTLLKLKDETLCIRSCDGQNRMDINLITERNMYEQI